MSKTVLVPLDGTPQAAAALPLARTVAHGIGGSLLLLRVAAKGDRSDDADCYLRAVARELQDTSVQSIVRHGDAAQEIVAIASNLEPDLIVMATHGRVGLQRIVAGSVAERVLTRSEVPLLLVRPGGKRVTHLNTLLVPTDGTAGAALALGTAVSLARATDARLVLVEAIEPVPQWIQSTDYGAAPSYIDPAWEDEAVSVAETYLQSLVSRLQALGIKADGHALTGAAVANIEKVADEVDADLIVMSTHARTGPARTLLGSTADALVRTAQRPVLLVRRKSSSADNEPADVAAAVGTAAN